jgi:hypothetical protein
MPPKTRRGGRKTASNDPAQTEEPKHETRRHRTGDTTTHQNDTTQEENKKHRTRGSKATTRRGKSGGLNATAPEQVGTEKRQGWKDKRETKKGGERGATRGKQGGCGRGGRTQTQKRCREERQAEEEGGTGSSERRRGRQQTGGLEGGVRSGIEHNNLRNPARHQRPRKSRSRRTRKEQTQGGAPHRPTPTPPRQHPAITSARPRKTDMSAQKPHNITQAQQGADAGGAAGRWRRAHAEKEESDKKTRPEGEGGGAERRGGCKPAPEGVWGGGREGGRYGGGGSGGEEGGGGAERAEDETKKHTRIRSQRSARPTDPPKGSARRQGANQHTKHQSPPETAQRGAATTGRGADRDGGSGRQRKQANGAGTKTQKRPTTRRPKRTTKRQDRQNETRTNGGRCGGASVRGRGSWGAPRTSGNRAKPKASSPAGRGGGWAGEQEWLGGGRGGKARHRKRNKAKSTGGRKRWKKGRRKGGGGEGAPEGRARRVNNARKQDKKSVERTRGKEGGGGVVRGKGKKEGRAHGNQCHPRCAGLTPTHSTPEHYANTNDPSRNQQRNAKRQPRPPTPHSAPTSNRTNTSNNKNQPKITK